MLWGQSKSFLAVDASHMVRDGYPLGLAVLVRPTGMVMSWLFCATTGPSAQGGNKQTVGTNDFRVFDKSSD